MTEARMADRRRYIGQEILRREDEYLLRGRGRFVDDLATPQDTVHLGFVMSPYAHARSVAIDASRALAHEGVIAVYTGEDIAKLVQPIVTEIEIAGYHKHGRDAVARGKVRFVGEHVAVVVAETAYAAHDGIELVDVEYEPLPAACELETATQADAPLVHESIPNNLIFKGQFSTREFEAGFARGEQVIRERFRSGRVAGVPMEPRGCFAQPDHVGDSIVFYSSTQVPHLLRTALARC